jgi:2-polyprenyl-3-methyl-5-hydroxy-6-metoxy-1,4-benzoquinol methylase
MTDWPTLVDENREVWQQNASFWDSKMGEGNDFYNILVAPSAESLLDLRPNHEVLEVACGNGNFSRRMAALGVRVTATDVSEVFIDRARTRTDPAAPITYTVLDATDSAALAVLGTSRFDAAVCNMAIMDIPSISPLIEALTRLLKPNGRFVFTMMHPCFNSAGLTKVIEEDDFGGTINVRHVVKVHAYATSSHEKGIGMMGQPVPQFYFHRPLNALFGAFFERGFALTGLLEPTFPPELSSTYHTSWVNYHEIPPVLAARLILIGNRQ